ncbi:MAG: hypothetical protein ABSF63_03555 [Candidatus Bathyarchaeia archaeon]|jgi:hypothetical protein
MAVGAVVDFFIAPLSLLEHIETPEETHAVPANVALNHTSKIRAADKSDNSPRLR